MRKNILYTCLHVNISYSYFVYRRKKYFQAKLFWLFPCFFCKKKRGLKKKLKKKFDLDILLFFLWDKDYPYLYPLLTDEASGDDTKQHSIIPQAHLYNRTTTVKLHIISQVNASLGPWRLLVNEMIQSYFILLFINCEKSVKLLFRTGFNW